MKEKINRKETKIYTIPVERTRIQVTREVYQAYYGFERHLRTLEEKDTRNGTVRYSDLDTEETLGEEMIPDLDAPAVETAAVTQVMRESLRKALAQLTKEEYELIQALYYENISEREYAAKLGLSQRGLNKRRHKALAKLKKILECRIF